MKKNLNQRFIGMMLLPCLCFVETWGQEAAPFPPPPSTISASATLVSDDEPGERLAIHGTVYHADGKTPYAGLVLYFYQTDATGVYNETDRSYLRPRLHGWIKTDEKGRYSISTVKPGTYPGGGTPAHIHVTMKSEAMRSVWLDSYLFEGDPYLSKDDLKGNNKNAGGFSSIVKTKRGKDGVLSCERDFLIE